MKFETVESVRHTETGPARLYDIIIPHFGIGGTPALAVRCLQTIRQYSQNHRVIFIDNGGEGWDTVKAELEQHVDFIVIRNTENIGFVRSVNLGIDLSTTPYVVLMNNDAEAAPGWLEKLRAPLDMWGNAGMSGPRSTDGGWQSRARQMGTVLLPPGSMLAFFCTMMRRTMIDEVGPQDEAFVPYAGFGGDDHYCWLAEQRGWRLAFVSELVIPHKRRTTMRLVHGAERIQKMQTEALAKFRRMQGGGDQ